MPLRRVSIGTRHSIGRHTASPAQLPETGSVMTSKYWPCVAACIAGVGFAFAADAILNRGIKDPPASVKATLPAHATDISLNTSAAAPERIEPLYFVPPTKPKPTPRSAKDEAIHSLEMLGMEATGANLAQAVRAGTLFNIDLLLRAGVGAEARDTDGRPMLVVACDAECVPAAQRLMEAGASADITGPDGRTPLMIAAARGNIDMMESLVRNGANLSLTDKEGHTALFHAVMAGDPGPVKWLIAEGIPPETDNCCNGSKSLVLHALATGRLNILEPVLQLQKPEHWCTETREALFTAVRQQNKPLIKALITNHGEAPTPEGAQQPLLGYTIAWGDPAVLRLLLECGADPNTPLGSPVEPAFSKLVPQRFVKHYLDTEAGVTPLMLAAGAGRLDCVEALLDYGAKRGAVTQKSKMAAISFAARSDSVEVMQRLLGKSPRPEDQQTRVEISLSSQTARLWKNDKLIMTSPVSTGRPGFRTPSGRFVITDKTRSRISSIYKVEMPYFMRLSCSEVGMHAGVVPNHPASHGCIRLPYGAAVRFYRELEVGTLVTIR